MKLTEIVKQFILENHINTDLEEAKFFELNELKIDASGNLTVIGNIVANGTM